MSTNTLNKTEARAACKKAGIKYGNMTVAQMREALDMKRYVPESPATGAPAVAEKPAKAVAPVKAAAAAKGVPAIFAPTAPREERNGVKRPAAGGKCAAAWEAFDQMLAAGTNPTAKAASEWAESVGANASNAMQELYIWRKWTGVSKPETKKASKEVAATA
jgi:hypothetical protein